MARGSVADVGEEKRLATKTRAQRFVLQMPLRYRVTGETKWRQGRTENISSTGVLFRTETFVQLNCPMEMRLVVPSVSTEGPVEMVCQCMIVRCVSAKGVDEPAVLAARILHFRMVRP